MSSVQINQLPAGIANVNAIVAADNADLSVTEKITLGDIVKLTTSADVSYDNTTSGLTATNAKAAIDELNDKKISSDITNITGASGINNIVQISQTDYDALGTYDQNTIYFIV